MVRKVVCRECGSSDIEYLGRDRCFCAHCNGEQDTKDIYEVVSGRWEEHPDEYGICATEFTCSVCKESYCTSELDDNQFIEMMKYCPNCGAKMNRESEVIT